MCKGFLIISIALFFNFLHSSLFAQKNSPQSLYTPAEPSLFAPRGIGWARNTVVPPSLYADRLGLICRQEWKLEKSSGVAFRFRLGSLDYVNRLEGKKY
jgi:hypothetical protein